jgi:hypothetical protein
MSSHIDPKILAKLRAFARRRRNLIIIRGLCAALAMLIATMLLVALIDWIFILPDEARWALSGAAYLSVIIVEWRTCIRQLARSPDPRQLARLVEHAEPKLREDLLSAVELGSTAEGRIFDSAQFRDLVQSDVAARVQDLEMGRLLPVKLLRRYLIVATLIVVALAVGFMLTGMQLGTLLMRALLPTGNFARVSKFQIEVVEPSPAERVVPQGDTVPLVIRVSGGRASKAVMETFSADGGREVVPMAPLESDRFSATIQVARQDVEYRIRAGDAMTRKYRLNAASRPHVMRFEKRYHYPSYTRSEAKTVIEENGDLAALEGTEAELRLALNQPVESGELRLEQGREQKTIPLERDGEQWVARVPMQSSGSYRVHLVGANTGFENKFSPEYEIRTEADLIPQVALELPKQDLLLPANDLVDIRGTASDDQALAKVSQLVRVNDGAWIETPLVQDPGAKAAVDRRWDLREQNARAGDLLTMKLVATDLKGNKAESRPIQLTITASGFESKRLQALEAQRLNWEALKKLRAAAEALEKRAAEAREEFKKLGEADPQRAQVVVGATTAMEEFEARLTEAVTQLSTTLRGATPAHESAELVLLGRFLARIDATTAQFARDALNVAARQPAAPPAAELMREFRDHATAVAHRVRVTEETARQFLGMEELTVVAENSRVAAQEQTRLATLAQNSEEDAAKWGQLTNRMRVVLAESRSIEALLESAAVHLEGGPGGGLRNLRKEVEKHRTEFEKALESGATGKPLLTATTNFTKATGDLSRRLVETSRDQLHLPIRLMTDLERQVEPVWTNLERLKQMCRR